MKKAIFWDFDGTLVSSNHLWSGSMLRLITSVAPELGITLEDVRTHMKTGFPWHTPFDDHSALREEKWWKNILERMRTVCLLLGLDGKAADCVAGKMRAEVTDVKNYDIYPDAADVLTFARDNGYENYILSNNYPELKCVMKKLGLAEYFCGFAVSGMLGFDKPRREIFEYALALAGNPEFSFMVGDNPFADIEGANSIGIPSVLVHNSAECPARYIFKTLSEMKNIL